MPVNLTLDPVLMDKARVIADRDPDRLPLARVIDRLLRQSIEAYEREHGPIKVEEN